MKKIGILLMITALTATSLLGAKKIKPGMVKHKNNQPVQEVNTWDAFYIVNESGYALDVAGAHRDAGTNVGLWERNGSSAQKFRIVKGEDDFYYILNENSGKFLDAAGGKLNEGDNIHIWYANSSKAQKFKFIDAGNGYYYIQISDTNYYVAPQYSNPDKGHNVIIWNSNSKCKWKLVKA
jgi:hypothetical protein